MIRGILAENKSLDRKVLEQLSRGEDEDIAAKAAETLEHVLEEEGDEEESEEDLEDDEDDEAGGVRRIGPLRKIRGGILAKRMPPVFLGQAL